MKTFLSTVLVAASFFAANAQVFRLQYSFEGFADALFFRYDPRQNIPMSNYVESIQDWSKLINDETIDTDEIYDRLDPKFMMLQPRLSANVHLMSKHLKGTFGVSTGRYQFRNFSWHAEALFRYQLFPADNGRWSIEVGYMMINDHSFGPEAAIRAAKNTPKEIKEKMKQFMTESLFERPVSKGLKMGAFYRLAPTVDLGLSGFMDFVERHDGARNDYASLSVRVRLEQMEAPVGRLKF